MNRRAPSIMVSSTFYDLKHVRAELSEFIIGMGYTPLLSEMSSFPVEPDATTIDNCRNRVMNDADILVLVIGGRYGYIDSASAKSITNLEYLTARSKGIPIYVFIDKSMLAVLPVWKQNKDATFNGIVDNTKVFEFIEQIRTVHQQWTFEFERSQEIAQTLRTQLSYLMNDGIALISKLGPSRVEARLAKKLQGQSLKIALDKSPMWEYHLFAREIQLEIAKHEDIRRDYHNGIYLGIGEYVGIPELGNWMQLRVAELMRISAAANALLNTVSIKAFGPPGEPGDAELIVYLSTRFGDLYRTTLEWVHKVKTTHSNQVAFEVLGELATFADDIINQLGRYGDDLLKKLHEVDLHIAQGTGTPITVNHTLTINLPDQGKFNEALRRLSMKIQRGELE